MSAGLFSYQREASVHVQLYVHMRLHHSQFISVHSHGGTQHDRRVKVTLSSHGILLPSHQCETLVLYFLELSRFSWKLKEKNMVYTIDWSMNRYIV